MLQTGHSHADVTITTGNWKHWSSRTLTFKFWKQNIPKNIHFKGLIGLQCIRIKICVHTPQLQKKAKIGARGSSLVTRQASSSVFFNCFY
uniref:Uncharacterized protein n=1 Tax=Anguilla anguilla TaxID=7936 RepID=A0A0E9U2W5_ANGAN